MDMHIPTTCGVRVYTWGTHHGAGNGLFHYLDSALFGGDVGHASIALTIPADEKGKELVEKYCQNLPYFKKKIITKQARINDNGRIIHLKRANQNEPAFEEEVYEIYFSWWPSVDAEKDYSLRENISDDTHSERRGAEFEWDKRWANYINPEKRTYRGKLGNRIFALNPTNIAHRMGYNDNQMEALGLSALLDIEMEQKESLVILKDKLQKALSKFKKDETYSLSISETLLLNNLISNWKHVINSPRKMTKNEVQKLLDLTVEQYDKVIKQQIEHYSRLNKIDPANKFYLMTNISHIENVRDHFIELENYLFKHKDEDISTQELRELILEFNKELNEDQQKRFGDFFHSILNKDVLTSEEVSDNLEKVMDYLESTKVDYDQLIEEKRQRFKKLVRETEQHTLKGAPADNSVYIPIAVDNFPDKNIGLPGGLDTEAMLKKMKELTEDEAGFTLLLKNCSKTTNAILKAGSYKRPDLQTYFDNYALGFFGNPQEVYNNASKFQRAVVLGDKPKGAKSQQRKFAQFAPIEKSGGRLIAYLMNHKVPAWKKGLAGFGGGIVIGIPALIGFTLRKIADPLRSYRKLRDITKYTYERNSVGLKAAATIFLAPLAIAFAPFAGIQYSAKKLFSSFANLFTKKNIQKTKDKENLILDQNISSSEKLNKRIAKLYKDNTVEIDIMDPEKALQRAKAILMQNDKQMPNFSKTALKNLTQSLQKVESNPEKAKKQEEIKALFSYIQSNILQRSAKIKREVLMLQNKEDLQVELKSKLKPKPKPDDSHINH